MIKIVLSKEGSIGSEDEHWLSRARYHFRMEEYWRDRAMSAELELEQIRNSSKSKNRVKKSSVKK